MSKSKRRERAENCAEVGAVKMLNNADSDDVDDWRGEERSSPVVAFSNFLAVGGYSSNPAWWWLAKSYY